MKVVVNRCWGGFGLSDEAAELCIERGMTVSSNWQDKADFIYNRSEKYGYKYYASQGDTLEFRTNPIVTNVVEELGEKSWGPHAKLEIVDIPYDRLDGWYIDEYDGKERINQEHMSW